MPDRYGVPSPFVSVSGVPIRLHSSTTVRSHLIRRRQAAVHGLLRRVASVHCRRSVRIVPADDVDVHAPAHERPPLEPEQQLARLARSSATSPGDERKMRKETMGAFAMVGYARPRSRRDLDERQMARDANRCSTRAEQRFKGSTVQRQDPHPCPLPLAP